ncbi:MAG: hypothetical protein FJ087_15160 [Deltaproteobacteria bacterium]|nr:hypothetical protein [Deltaproteobacteria bacterium]
MPVRQGSCFGLPDAEFSVCLDTNCKDPFLACFAGDRIYTCVELNECIRGCPDNDDACVQNCFNMSGYLANWDWEKRVGCFRAECPVCLLAAPTTAQQQECRRCAEKAIFGACAVEYQRCWTAGNAKCAEMWDCAQACPDEVACVNACRDAATFAAQGKFQAVYTCADEQCPGLSGQAWADCATESVNGAGACVPALTACMDDADECATHCAPADGCGADGCGGSCGSCSGGKDCSGATATCS